MNSRVDVQLDALTGSRAGLLVGESATLEPTGGGKTFYLETFGCQMNVHDSEKVAGVLLGRGYRQVDTFDAAKLVLYNTCSIREKAAHKIYSRLGAYRKYPGEEKIIGVLGCVAQQEGEKIFDRAPHVSLVAGSASYTRLGEMLVQLEAGNRRVTGLSLDTEETFDTPFTRRDNPHRAYITIIEGCDKSCAYCVVPFTRGPERSRTSESVMAEARGLAAKGYTEIQLLGQNVNSYRDPSPAGWDFAALIGHVAHVPGIRRVRYTTSHPRDFVKSIMDAMDANPVLCDHVHLPVQSGSSRVLAAMDRLYTRDDYMRRIEWIKNAKRRYAITTDIIVGFPGETERDFQETLDLLDEIQYDSLFSFKYSPRPNTAAIAMPDRIPEEEKQRRLVIVQEKQRAIQIRRNAELIGGIQEVLVEGRNQALGQWIGRTSCNRPLNFSHPGSEEAGLLGTYLPVLVTRSGPNSLVGESVAQS
jgi:tRNA-2-methylthio-N6-dimethylallyladenosine synthase